MPLSELRLVKRCAQWIPKEKRKLIPDGVRGIYALHKKRPRIRKYDVVYIGMTSVGKVGLRSRLDRHARSSSKDWTHFSLFAVWDNISPEEVEELEGLFREIYRKDKRANKFNKQKKCGKLQEVREDDLASWKGKV